MERKIFFNFIFVLLIGVLICGILSVEIIEKNYNQNIENRLVSNTSLVRELITENLNQNNYDNLNEYFQKIKSITDSRITVIGLDGKVIIDTEKDATTMDNHSGRPEIIEALKGNTGKAKRYSNTMKVNYLYIAQPIYKDGKITEILRLSTPLYEINHLMRKLYISALISILTGLLIASIMGYRISKKITKPVKVMTAIASQISKGHFEQRIDIKSKDEIGELANSINYMASTLSDTINSVTDKNIKMEAILSSVVNGIIAIDSDEKILFINPVAIDMLNIKESDVAGKHFLQVVRNNQIDNYLKYVIKHRSFYDTEITLNYPHEKILKLYTNPIKKFEKGEESGIIITIQDITELRKLENMRTEFVANVSHELKTPLTSIKGFVETLKIGAIEDKEDSIRFLNIIEDEADRLSRLISDILSLSELEGKKVKVAHEKIRVQNTIAEIISMLSSQAVKKNITLLSEVNDGSLCIMGDLDKFKQMLINLVDNGIKYTPEGGTVKVEALRDGGYLVINVIDNGIGIPDEYIPRLFERFYRVDKARSRKVGGTGLGLAIVKHIVKTFDGEISVESKVGEGTKFTIFLPV